MKPLNLREERNESLEGKERLCEVLSERLGKRELG
jgi:hypothetical protein